MRRLFFLILSISFAFGLAHGQSISRDTQSIEKRYTEVLAQAGRMLTDADFAEKSNLAVNELVVNRYNKSWAAVGNYKVVYRFFYKSFGEEPYPDHLVFVTKETTSAAREYREEFLFGNDGSLELATWAQPSEKIRVNGIEVPGKVSYYYKGTRMIYRAGITKKANPETPTEKEMRKNATKLVRLFALSIDQ